MKRLFIIAIAISFLFISVISAFAANDKDIFLVHLKTSLKKDDAQIFPVVVEVRLPMPKGGA